MTDTISSSEFENEMIRIEGIQEEVSKILHNKNWLVKWFYFGKARKLHFEAEDAMRELWSKNVVED